MTKPKVFVQPPWEGPTRRLFEAYEFPLVETPEECDIIAFNGGEDVHPTIYHQKPSPDVDYWLDIKRDKQEIAGYERAKDKFKFGICRGGQLLNCLNGGTLWHDVSGHNSGHQILVLKDGQSLWSSSVHHQMMIPTPEATMLAVANVSNHKLGEFVPSRRHKIPQWGNWYRSYDGDVSPFDDDPEVLFYQKDRALCIQGHPEYSGYKDFTEYCMNLIEELY